MKDKLDSVGKKSAAGDFSRHIVAHIIDYIREYILGQLRESFLTVICILLLVIITDLILFTSSSLKKNISDIAYLNVFLAVVVCVFGIIGQLRFRSRYLKLRTALNKKEGIDYLLPVDSGFSASLLRDAVELKNQECFDKTGALQGNLDELNDYITKWVHEIKIPISICELIAENITSEEKEAHRLKIELERTKFLINQVLYAGRASRYDKDLSMGEFALSKVVSDAVKRNSAFFIQKNIEVSLESMKFNVVNDEKWVAYILDQILNNAGKYTGRNGQVEIRAAEDGKAVRLSIRDNGIGIAAQDIGRIFDKGFTGENGRRTVKSTGMGLYYSKTMADKLGIGIEVTSAAGEYTEFVMIFYKFSDLLKVT